jgi:ketosteroid isomerase-like protein
MANNSNEIQIRRLVENWARAVRARDTEGVLANHTDDIVMFDVPPPIQSKGMAAHKKTWDLFFSYSAGGEGSFDLVELSIAAGDTVAFCHALLRIDGEKRPQCRLTVGLQKVRGKWLIAHEHHSYPIALQQGQ